MFGVYRKAQSALTLSARNIGIAAMFGFVVVGYSAANPVHAADAARSLAAAPEDTTIFYNFPGTPKLAVSRNGNLVRFEGPVGYEHIAVGGSGEGYVLCYGSTNAYDLAIDSFTFGFGPSSASCSGSVCNITRNTLDGKLQLKQKITKDPPLERSVTIEMTLKNLTGSAISGIIFRRHADLNIDTGGPSGTGDFDSWFAASERDSAFAWNGINAHAQQDNSVVLRNYDRTPKTIPQVAKITSDFFDTTCSPTNIAADGAVFGDFATTIQYNVGTLGAGKSAVLTVQYERN